MADYDFANILFAGPCNRACPWCVGHRLPDTVNVDNLSLWPLRGIDAFIDEVNRHCIPEVVTTGTVTDPQLYKYEAQLVALLRKRLHPRVRLSLHTNGVRALRKLSVVNSYDRVCISFPSFEPRTYQRMMGSASVPDLAALVERARVPVKVSCVLDEPNLPEVEDFLRRCRAIGVRRVVLRKLFGETRQFDVLRDLPVVRTFKNNPVVDLDGMEVTYWDFSDTSCRSINLFADGTLGRQYLLTDTLQLRRSSAA